jgi:hypothetical protein
VAVPPPHRSPKAPPDVPWDWAANSVRYTNELLAHGGWHAMALAHTWYEDSDRGPPRRKSAYKLPHHRLFDDRVRVVLSGVRAAMNILAATRFDPEEYRVNLPAAEVPAVYEHLAVHLRQFGEKVPRILKGWSPEQGWPPRR